MLQQLSYFLLLALVSAQCFSASPIPALSTYSVLLTNAQAGTTSSQYAIASKNKNTQLAICNIVTITAISSMQAVSIFNWRLAVKSKNDSTLTLAFYHIDASWISVGGVVWQTSSPDLIVGYSTLSGNMGSEMYRLPLKQNIRNQQASVAILFINGINASQVKEFELSVRAVRIAQKNIYVNITTRKQVYIQLKGIHVSYIVFSPIYASFDSYGDSLTYKTSKQEQYSDVYNDMPPTTYKIYGMTSFHVRSQPSGFYFNSVMSSSYVLMVSNNVSDITIDYLYLVSGETSCQSCGQSHYLYNDSCVGNCPEGSIIASYQNLQFCRVCPDSLNLVANQAKGVCECGQGYEMGKQSKCIEMKTLSPYKTQQVVKFIPAELLKKGDTIIKNQVKEEAKNSVIDRKSVNQSSVKEVQINKQVEATVKLQVSSLAKNDNAAAKTDSLAASKIEASPNKITAALPTTSTKTEAVAIKPQATTLPKTDNPNTNTKSGTPPNKDSKQVPAPNTPKPPTNQGISVVKPIIPIIVTSGSPISSPLSVPNCSLIANSTLIAGSCVCQIGFINISNHCVPLMDMVLNTAIPSTLKVSTSVSCSLNQIFSISQNRCVCAPGFRMSSQNICEKFCGINERINTTDNSCRCLQGYTRINDVCQLCKVNGTFFGNQTCYLLTNSTVCRKNYTQSNGFCLRCLNITKYSFSNSLCLNCADGLIYNGSGCSCPAKSNYMNGTCLSPRCGDKIIQTDQTCDDGNVINYDGCSSTCFIQSGWNCQGAPSKCVLSRCGDGIINGGELCDDGNTNNGDGCSQLCLVEPDYSCISKPSNCYPYQTGNLTLISVLTNTNIVYVELQTPQNPTLADPQLPPSFIKLVYLSKNQMVPTSYCRQQQGNLYRFMCLLIYPSGIPNQKVHVLYRYSWAQLSGSVLFEINPGLYVPAIARGKTLGR